MFYSCVVSLIKYLKVLDKHAPLKRNYLEQTILLISLNLCGKQLLEGPTWKKFIAKVNRKKALKLMRNRKAFVEDFTKKEETFFQ